MRRNSAGSGGSTVHGCSQQRTSSKPAARRRASVSSGAGVVPGRGETLEVGRVGLARGDLVGDPAQPRDVAGAAALRGEPAAGLQHSADLREEQVVVERSSGRRRWRRPRRRAQAARAASGRRPAPRPPAAGARAPSRPSTGSRRRRSPCPSGSRSISIAVTRPLPQPASSTVSSPTSWQALEHRLRPLLVRDRDAVVARGVPVPGVAPAIRAPWSPGRDRPRRTARRRRSPRRSRA